VKYDEQDAVKETYRANIAKGSGIDLPAILGLDSMKEKDSVIILREGKEMMVFPGPGGYKIEWSPGTKVLPMKHAPSGHLVVPCGKFGDLPSTSSTDHIAFWTDHTNMQSRKDESPPRE
jgi:hypothetical protein